MTQMTLQNSNIGCGNCNALHGSPKPWLWAWTALRSLVCSGLYSQYVSSFSTFKIENLRASRAGVSADNSKQEGLRTMRTETRYNNQPAIYLY